MLSRTSAVLLRGPASTQLFRYASRAAASHIVSNPSTLMSPVIQRRLKHASYDETIEENPLAHDAYKKSCYVEIDFTIPEDHKVYEAIQKFSAYNIGCLVTTDASGKISGVISERDYITKIALLGRASQDTDIKEISTKSANLVTASPHDPVQTIMDKMLARDIRHLPLIDDDGKVIGMLSIKDVVKVIMEEREKTIQTLTNFASGKGGYFIED